jgi:hypothetical protein
VLEYAVIFSSEITQRRLVVVNDVSGQLICSILKDKQFKNAGNSSVFSCIGQ